MAEAAQELGPEVARRVVRLFRQLQEVEQEEVKNAPTASLSDVMVRDPETGERRVFGATTVLAKRKIRFKAVTLADQMEIPDDTEPVDWSLEVKASVLNRNLVEPDIRSKAGGEVTAEWLADNMTALDVDDLVVTIWKRGQPQFRVPAPPADDDEKKSPTGAGEYPIGSSSDGSTTSDTPSSVGSPPTG